jgi:hypothetical protein
VSLTPQQRAQILYLYQVERVRTVVLAKRTGPTRSTVMSVVHPPRRQDASAMRPSSQGHVERQLPLAHDDGLREGTS